MEKVNSDINPVPGPMAYESTDLFDIITQHGGNMVIAADKSLHIVMLNKAAQQGFDITEQQGLQKQLPDLVSVGGRSIADDINMVLTGKSRLQSFRLTDMGRHLEWKVYPLKDRQRN